MTKTYPALERLGPVLTEAKLYLGFAEVAEKWGVSASAIRTFWHDDVSNGANQYLPKPDIGLVRDDEHILPGWEEATIDNFVRRGPGNHTRGENRRGNTKGAKRRYSEAFTTLGALKANAIRSQVRWLSYEIDDAAPPLSDDVLTEIAAEHSITLGELQAILSNTAWPTKMRVPGTTDWADGHLLQQTPTYAALGYRRSMQIREKAAAGTRIIDLATEFGIHPDEVKEVLDEKRWPSTRPKRRA